MPRTFRKGFLIGSILFAFMFAGCQSTEQQVKPSPSPIQQGQDSEPAPQAGQAATGNPQSLFDTVVMFQDTFEDNRNGWAEKENGVVSVEISSGRLEIQHKRKIERWIETVKATFEAYEDFTIESTIRQSSGADNHGFGLVWGRDSANYYRFLISGNGQYSFQKNAGGRLYKLIDWKHSKHIKTGGSKNRLTIKKAGSKYEFYVNGNLLGSCPFEKFFGYGIGFQASRNIEIRIDDITVTGKRTIPQIFETIRAEAEKGSPYHQALLGHAYRTGFPFKEDDPQGEKLIRASAEKGHPFGVYELGRLYDKGEDYAHDKNKAEDLYEQAYGGIKTLADLGDPMAQAYLGRIYYYGYGVKKDFTQALDWFTKSATQGNYDASTMLGVMYLKAEGVDKNEAKAYALFLKDARKGYRVAQYDMGVMYHNGMSVKVDFSNAAYWYRKAAAQNFAKAQNNLGLLYEWGTGVKMNLAKAAELYRKAAEQGEEMAQTNLGLLYESGRGLAKDRTEAFKWYRKAAEQGEKRALTKIGKDYETAATVDRNLAKATLLYYLASEKGDSGGKNALESLDRKAGLRLPVTLLWKGDDRYEFDPALDELVQRAIGGYKAGMTDIGLNLFNQALGRDALKLYRENLWYPVYTNNLPMSLISRLLLQLKGTLKEKPEFWFFYAHGAVLSGQPALALPAVEQMETLLAGNPDDPAARRLNSLPALMKATAMIQMGKTEAAYTMLFAAGKPEKPDSALIDYVNLWLKPLLQDKKKLAFVMDIEEKKLFGTFGSYPPQSYHHPITGNLVKAVTQAPKLEPEAQPETPATTTPAVDSQKSVKPKKPVPKAKIID